MQPIKCPDCKTYLQPSEVGAHVQNCQQYVPVYLNSLRRSFKTMSPECIFFVAAEIDIIKEELLKQISAKMPRAIGSSPEKKQVHPEKKEVHPEKKEVNPQKKQLNPQKKQLNPEKAEIRESKGNSLIKDMQNKKDESNIDRYLDLKVKGRQDKSRVEPKKEEMIVARVEARPSKLAEKKSFSELFVTQQVQSQAKQAIIKERLIECSNSDCKQRIGIDDCQKFVYLYNCLHIMCLPCAKAQIRKQFISSFGVMVCPQKQCQQVIPDMQVRELAGEEEYQQLEMQLNRKGMNLVKCLKCHEEYEFLKGKPKDAPKKTEQGVPLSATYANHFAENRFSCPKCKSEQCKQCGVTPYHLGSFCEEFKEQKLKKKCRYCRSVIPAGYENQSGLSIFNDICDEEDCVLLRKTACAKRLPCKHPCNGVIKEVKCLPCLNQKCALENTVALHGQNETSYCSLCYVESLSESPCIQSACGHIFHQKCIKKRLSIRWGTPRIFFKFCECPLCSSWLDVPKEMEVYRTVQKNKELFELIKDKSIKRLKHEGNDKDEILKDKNSQYFGKEDKYALAIYAYFECFQCKQPYFGGRKSCAEAMQESKDGMGFNPKELICPSCCPVSVMICSKHGKEYISFKCKFCCSIAQWFCWGNTHFCDDCHNKQISPNPVSKIPREKLPKCQGKAKCPSGGDHGLNGEEKSLGCALCRNLGDNIRDF